MKILGIDTSTSTASVAIVENGHIVAQDLYPRQPASVDSGPKSNHAEIILPLVESVLKHAGLVFADLGGIGVSNGPGSFTGVRIGLTTVKGLAYGTELPVVGISTLQAIASRVANFAGTVCSLLDARKNEAYAALFRTDKNHFERLTEDEVVPILSVFDRVIDLGDSAPCLFIGEGVTVYRPMIEQLSCLKVLFADERAMPTLAASVARLGERQLGRNEGALLGDLRPVYLRRPECEFRRKSPVSN
jgi:tRNA threonylcarbamoyladenosine biosynthesis protein TsaB